MKTKPGISLILLLALVISGCKKEGERFEISGQPDPLRYGGCNDTKVTFKVTGSGEGIRVDGIIVAYQLFNGEGVKVKSGSLSLTLSPSDPPVTYTGSVTFKIASSTVYPAEPDTAIMDFGEGKVVFAATVSAFDLSPSGGATYFFTSTKSVKVIPCGPTPLPPPPKPTATPVPTLTATPTATPTASPTVTATPVAAPNLSPTQKTKPTPCGPNGCPPP